MTDVREAIMARLLVIADGVAGVDQALRNDNDPGDQKTVTVVVLEGDEQPTPSTPEGRHRLPSAPRAMVMIPQLMIIGKSNPSTLGTNLNTIRAGLIKAIESDATLQTLCGRHRPPVYRAMASDLGLGRAMLGRMSLHFEITYLLAPADL